MTVDKSLAMERIHQVCQQTPINVRILQTLVQGMPSAVEFRSPRDEWLPLHRACRRQPSLVAVRTLVQAWPDSVREWTGGDATAHPQHQEDEEARLPIHLACQYGASLAVVQYLAQKDPTCLQAVSPHKMYTALDFSLYYYHHRRQQGLDVTEAERVVSFLANARVQDAPEDWKQQHKAAASEPLPTVHARPVMTQPQQPPRETKPHATPTMMRRSYPSYTPSPIASRPSYNNNNNNNNKTSGKSSKIIRLSTLRPAVSLR